MRHARLRAGLPALVLLALSACGGTGPADREVAVSSGDPSACPGEILDVVVSVGAWGDVVRSLGGDCATVTTLTAAPVEEAAAPPVDPAALDGADLVLVNGARYDDWAVAAAEDAAGDPLLLRAAELAGAVAPGADPHLWYDPRAVPEVAAGVARELARLSPDAAPYFGARHATLTAELQPWLETVAALREDLGGRTYAAPDRVFGRTAAALGLVDVTPAGFPRGAQAGGAPAADDLATFEASLRGGAVDVLVAVQEGVPEPLRDAADDAGVPVLEVAEFPPDDASFVAWQLAQLASLSEALSEDR